MEQHQAMDEMLAALDAALPGGDLGTLLSYPSDLRFIAARGEGSKLYDERNREYLDFLMGSGPLILGHAHPGVVAAVQAQIARGSTFYQPTASIAELAQAVLAASPCAEKLRFVTTGAEASYYALRLARSATGRDKVLKFAGAYHGSHDYGLVGLLAGGDFDPVQAPTNTAGIPAAAAHTVVVSDFNDLAMAEQLMQQHGSEIAAIIVEPILGVVPPEPGFLEGLRALADAHGTLLIFDEMITGFRLAYGGAQEAFGVVPDLATYGKIVGGGYPAAMICGRADIMELSRFERRSEPDYVMFSGTFFANPVAAAAGAATLRELREPGTYQKLTATADRLREGIRAAAAELGITLQVLGVGPVFNVFFTTERVRSHRQIVGSRLDLGRELLLRLASERVLVAGSKGWLSTAHTQADIDAAIEAYRRCFTAMQTDGLL